MVDKKSLIVQFKRYAESVVNKACLRYSLSSELKEELMAVAYLELVETVERYEPDKARHFICYASYRIKGAVYYHIYKAKGWRRNRAKIQQLRASEAYNNVQESTHLVGEKSLSNVFDSAAYAALSYALTDGYEDGDGIIERQSYDDQLSPEDLAARKEIFEKIKSTVVTLTEKEQLLIDLYYYRGLNYDEIAEQLHIKGLTEGDLPVTKSWISRQHSRALDKIKRKLANTE